jgi:hypothetical protein
MPSIAVGTIPLAIIAEDPFTLIEVMQQDLIAQAGERGRDRRVVWRNACAM